MTEGPDTRLAILDAALELFAERGYAETTMRAIAVHAGVAPSHAYYYFRSKEELIQAFYRTIQIRHTERARRALREVGTLEARLAAVANAGLDVMGPYHEFGTAFAGSAMRFDSPQSPFSTESAGARELSLRIFRELVDGCRPAVPNRIKDVLPDILWLGFLAVVLFWASDDSPEQKRTRDLVDTAVPLISGLVRLARLPLTGGVIEQLTAMIRVILPTGKVG